MEAHINIQSQNIPISFVYRAGYPYRLAEDGYRLLRDGERVGPNDEYSQPSPDRNFSTWISVIQLALECGGEGSIAGEWYWGSNPSEDGKILYRRKITKGEQALSQIET